VSNGAKEVALPSVTMEPRSPQAAAERGRLDRLRAGDERAFAELVNEHHATLLRVVRCFVSSRATAEEIVQETWVGVIEGLAKFEGRSSLKTWIFNIATNRAKTRGVREGRSQPFSSLENDDEGPAVATGRFLENGMWRDPPKPPFGDENPEHLAARRETVAEIETAFDQLPERQRLVVILRDVEGLDAEEVCNILEVSETNLRVLLHRGRSLLRSILEQQLGGKK
jgi:RNA polymerase sigma-70 factor, ECF subfamily